MTERIHMMGICGSGMSSLALWYSSRGAIVSGCDRSPGDNLRELENAGIDVYREHDPSHVVGIDRLVFSAAVPEDHPELAAARNAGVTVLRRSEALARLANDSRLLAIAGAHGKTTTTAMTGWILQEAGLDPTVMVGGRVTAWNGNFRAGSRLAVVEADEYDRTFLRLTPDASAVTSFAHEHLECYGSPEALTMAFGIFLEMTRPGGRVVVPFRIRDLAVWAERIGRSVITTGPGGEMCAQRGRCGVWEQEYTLMGVEGLLPMPGEHNLRNAETAIALAQWAGVNIDDAVNALRSFPGVSRRMERVGELGSMLALSDYAHHPDEMKAAIKAAREVSRGGVGVVFQPHLYSRTAAQAPEMGKALSAADWSLVLPIYPARETPLPGVSSRLVVDAAVALGADCSLSVPEELGEKLRERTAELVIFMGAGSVDSVCREMVGAGL